MLSFGCESDRLGTGERSRCERLIGGEKNGRAGVLEYDASGVDVHVRFYKVYVVDGPSELLAVRLPTRSTGGWLRTRRSSLWAGRRSN